MIIGICDDDKIWYRRAEGLIEQYAEETGQEVALCYFPDTEALLAYEGAPLEALFMDIELNGENGVKAALQVNAKWAHCQIVFLTNYLNYATDVYEAEHVMFVLKEQFAERLGSVFAKIAHEREQHRKQLCFVCVGKQTVYLAPDEIYYFERRGRKTIIETVWGSYELFDKIEDIMKRLPEGEFVRCHNSYVVYLPNIKEAKSGTFQMRNGQMITISRGYEKETKTAFMRWVRGQMV